MPDDFRQPPSFPLRPAIDPRAVLVAHQILSCMRAGVPARPAEQLQALVDWVDALRTPFSIMDQIISRRPDDQVPDRARYVSGIHEALAGLQDGTLPALRELRAACQRALSEMATD